MGTVLVVEAPEVTVWARVVALRILPFLVLRDQDVVPEQCDLVVLVQLVRLATTLAGCLVVQILCYLALL